MTVYKMRLEIHPSDIKEAVCGNRRQCVLARAINRQFNLKGSGRVSVDANGIAFTLNGFRHLYTVPKAALLYLRRFDEIGETLGVDAARTVMKPETFTCKFVEAKPIEPVRYRGKRTHGVRGITTKRYVGI